MAALEDLITPRMQRGMERMVTALNAHPEEVPVMAQLAAHTLRFPVKPGRKWIERCLPLRKVAIDNK